MSDSTGVWLDALKDLTPKALEKALERIKTFTSGGEKFMEFPPNCLQFKGLCLDFYNSLKLPKSVDAYREIVKQEFEEERRWSHKIVKFIASRLPEDFFCIEENRRQALFSEAYEGVCHLVKQGHALPKMHDIVVKLKVSKSASPAVAEGHLQDLRKYLGY